MLLRPNFWAEFNFPANPFFAFISPPISSPHSNSKQDHFISNPIPITFPKEPNYIAYNNLQQHVPTDLFQKKDRQQYQTTRPLCFSFFFLPPAETKTRNPEPPAVQIETAQKIDPLHFLFFPTLTKKCQSSVKTCSQSARKVTAFAPTSFHLKKFARAPSCCQSPLWLDSEHIKAQEIGMNPNFLGF
ncbi:hypothetical protein H5410_017861 [Solanum commersonii]|uniref:Uncharacterized protein n=1 Tax=Solanum commersonii TaxID=4109 RepID=A0A9J6A0D2_SOLCO|nr:hypothetical protein H5410_017861 [Solanum commersonii]